MVFPLYVNSLPVELLAFLEEVQRNPPKNKPRLSVLINCGFLEPGQNDVAVDILRLFEYQTDDEPVTFCWLGRKNDQVFLLTCRGIPDPERVLELLAAQLS